MRIRTIKPEFWLSEEMARLPDFTRLLAIALLNYSDDEGYFMANPELIRGQIFPFEDNSSRVQRGLVELSNVDFLRLHQTLNGRLCGHVVNFTKHQRIDRANPSKIKPLINFDDDSSSPQRVLALGTGNREQGTGSREGAAKASELPQPNSQSDREAEVRAARENNSREIGRTLPPSLQVGPFIAAWERWIVHWSQTYNRGQPIPFATADNHLKIFNELGVSRAIAAIENSISRNLREPAEAFKNNATHRPTNGRNFELAGSGADYAKAGL